jgi:opine dehydrogenase
VLKGATSVEERAIAVLGSGNGGLNFAGDLTLAGHEVRLFELPRFKESLLPVIDAGGIELAGLCRTGFAKPAVITTDVGEALQGAEVVLVSVPAYGHAEFARVCGPHLEKEQIVVLNPGYTLGSIEFSNLLMQEGVDIENITICETISLLYATRKYLPNRVFCEGVKVDMPISAFPGEKTEGALEVLSPIYRQEDGKRGRLFPLENVLLAALTNGNPVLHVPMMLLKAVDVELGEEPYWKCRDSTAIKLMRRELDQEMIRLQVALGFEPLSHDYVHDTLMYPSWAPLIDTTDPECDADLPEWVQPKNQPGLYAAGQGHNFLQMRYLTEDVPYALVGLSNLGDLLDVATPVIDASITLASTVTGTDYWRTGRTLRKLGLAHFGREELLRYVTTGRAA